ncbi:MAG: acyltransferase [Akkermansia sp.]|nr:acyltransferase [Akkermansia sp.]
MPQTSQHSYGIDIARILAMFFVCVLHLSGWWKGMANAPTLIDRAAAVTFWSLAYVGVNLFMMITGYLGIERNWKTKSFLRLWGQVAFYLMGGILVSFLLNDPPLRTGYFISLIFPIPFANGYWYFTAYAGAFFLFPYLNKGFLILSKQEKQKLLITLFFIICIFGFYNKHVWGGFNAVWMLVMYLVGAYLKLHPLIYKTKYLLIVYLCSSIFAGLLFSLDSYLRHSQGFSLPFPGLDYTSPLTVCASIACFAACARMQPSSPLVQNVLKWFAPLMFAVYLIHTHPALMLHFGNFTKWFARYSHYGWWHIPVGAALIFIFCSFVEYARQLIFKSVGRCFATFRAKA